MIEDFVTKSIIVSKNLEFRAPQDIVVTNKIDFCSIAAMLVKTQKAEIFQVGKRNIKNQKMIDSRGNAKIALPR